MAEVKWIKICTDLFDDEKIRLIEDMPKRDSIIVIWFKLLCMAGKQNNSGVFMMNEKLAYTDKMLATIFNRPIGTVKLALQVFEQYGMIEIVDGTITIPNWEKHQNLDKYDKAKEKTRQRVANYRKKQKELLQKNECNSTCNDYSNATVTQSNAVEVDKDTDTEIDNTTNLLTCEKSNFDWSQYSQEELSDNYPGTVLTIAEYDKLYMLVNEYALNDYCKKIERYTDCKEPFKTILEWAIKDGNLKNNDIFN